MECEFDVIVVSGNFEGDPEAIAEALNRFSFVESCESFVVDHGRIYAIGSDAEDAFPSTVYPTHEVIRDDEGRIMLVRDDPPGKHEKGAYGDRRISLKFIADAVSPYIERGYIEISRVTGSEGYELEFQTLVIRADGSGERYNLQRCSTRSFQAPDHKQSYVPDNVLT
jgi:hypothetical protein